MESNGIDRRFVDALVGAERDCQSAEHLIRVIMPVVKDQKMLLRALETLHRSAVSLVSVILKYEYLFKRVQLYKDTEKNLEVFFRKCAGHYGLSIEEKESLRQLLLVGKKHKQSGFEFSRVGKMVILDDDLSTTEVNRQTIESFIFVLRRLLINTRNVFSRRGHLQGNY